MNRHVAIVGAGFIGRAWAIVFARAGFSVAVYDAVDTALAQCQRLLLENISDLAEHGLISEAPATVLARIRTETPLPAALKGACLVQECAYETLEIKRAVFAELDRHAAPDTILASSTSWLKASEFSEGLAGRARVLVAHPVNPPYLIPLVELAPAPWTDAAVLASAKTIYQEAGQVPVVLHKEITGFLLNRIQAAVLNEALNLYADGFASMEDMDLVLKNGLGMRWSFMGPFETIDLNAPQGLMDYADRYGSTFREVAADQATNPWNRDTMAQLHAQRREVLPARDLQARARWRDRRLMALIAHQRDQPH
ncbi:MAG: 3-hydroxyacyl-CoA dehydrogenase [Alphaproteobacteria bacterium]|nr:3-hydroxyacyl-CoA dehydrogenase [Alphaproteobacteria bacterium]